MFESLRAPAASGSLTMDASFFAEDAAPPFRHSRAVAALAGSALNLGQSTKPCSGLLAKHVADRLIAAVALVLLAPLLVMIAIAVRLDSAGPVLFTQSRPGRFQRDFAIFKFRTMHRNRADHAGCQQTVRGDCRVTRVGNFLRRTSLDELPQLWNVLNGTMSLVGPRPQPAAMRTAGLLSEEIAPDYPARHLVKPGITGLAQINGNRGATETPEQLRARLADDLLYIETWSLWLDLRILLLTPIRLVLHRNNAF